MTDTVNYKGVRGGDPSMHPQKVFKKTICPDCGVEFTMWIGINKEPKGVCKDCHHAQCRICVDCRKSGSKDNPVTLKRDPWKLEHNNDAKLYLLCDYCYGQSNIDLSYSLHDDFDDSDGEDWP